MNVACKSTFWPLPWGHEEALNGLISSIIIKFQLQSQIQRFLIPNCVCAFINERCKSYRRGFFILLLGSCPRGGAWGCWGPNFFSSKHGHMTYQIEGDDKKLSFRLFILL